MTYFHSNLVKDLCMLYVPGQLYISPFLSQLVNFPQYGEKDDTADIDILEEDLKRIPGMDAKVNERIREQFGE